MTAQPTALGRRSRQRRSGAATRPPGWLTMAFLLPAGALYGLLLLYPMATALSYSFFTWEGTSRVGFAGLANFIGMFTDGLFRGTLLNALGHNVAFFVVIMVVQNTLGMWLAWQVNRTRARKVLRVLYTAPYLVSALVVGFLWRLMLGSSGAINGLLTQVGLEHLTQGWLGDPSLALPATILVTLWHWIGFPILLYGAAIAGLPQELLDAASVDGASGLRRFWHVAAPLLVPAIGTITVLTFISTMESFAIPYALGGSIGAPAGATDVLGLVFYRTAFQPGDLNALGRSSAFAVLLFIFIFGCSTIANKYLRRKEVSQ